MWRAIVIFLLVYAGLAAAKRHRWLVAWLGVAAALVTGALGFEEIVTGVNWNVIGIFVGSLILAELFIFSRLPETISDWIVNSSTNLGMAFLAVIGFASVLSIFIENVVTVLIVAPIALQLCRKSGISPVTVIIGLAVASNLQGVAILIGDTPSMILAARMRMNFLDFFVYRGRVGIFFLVELGALASLAVLFFMLRGIKQVPERLPVTKVRSWMPTILISITVVLLSFATLADEEFTWFGGTVCMVVGVGGLFWYAKKRIEPWGKLLRTLDWPTVAFLAAIFALVTMLEERGVVDRAVSAMAGLAGLHPFVTYTIMVWFSVLVSAFIDNIPYVTAVLPVMTGLSARLGLSPELLVFGVLIGACLGGNITPIGASANIVAVGILEKNGYRTSFWRFMKIGVPFTVAAAGSAYLALWLVYR